MSHRKSVSKKKGRVVSVRSGRSKVLVIGLGEVGGPLRKILERRYPVVGVDIQPVAATWKTSIMHVCYPFHDGFVETTAEYIRKYSPEITVINSTVPPGTTRAIARRTGGVVINSPVRGKHARMVKDMARYPKWVGGLDSGAVRRVRAHFAGAGMKTRAASSPEASELAKLLETTYFGVCITWAQEVERFGRKVGVPYEEIDRFFAEIPYFQQRYTPGFIGGHCVIPNTRLLKRDFSSPFLDAILDSNERKQRELAEEEPAQLATVAR